LEELAEAPGYLELSTLPGTRYTTQPFWYEMFTSQEGEAIEKHRQGNDRSGQNLVHKRAPTQKPLNPLRQVPGFRNGIPFHRHREARKPE
jgi:hypothetical protein